MPTIDGLEASIKGETVGIELANLKMYAQVWFLQFIYKQLKN